MLDKKWIADVVGRMHIAGITGQDLARESGYNSAYLSVVLHGEKGDERTQAHIEIALDCLCCSKRFDCKQREDRLNQDRRDRSTERCEMQLEQKNDDRCGNPGE